jgi:hypothetical protein
MTGGKMTDNVTLNREQIGDIFKALTGIGNLVKGLVPKSGNPVNSTPSCRTSP